jgi:hypothetical protein
MEPNNDAIVLNVSDGGLGFRAYSPVTQSGMIRFSFSENGRQTETSGELVWTDSTKMIGGLSFAFLSRANRQRIRNWVDKAGTPKSAWAASQHETPPLKEPPLPVTRQPQENAPSYFSAPRKPLPQSAQPRFELFEDDPQRIRYRWDQEMLFPNSRAKCFFRGFLAGAIVSTILAAILFFAYGGPTETLRKQVSAWIGARPAPQAAPAVLPPVAFSPPLVLSGLPSSGNLDSSRASSPLSASANDPKTNGATAKSATEQALANAHFARDSGGLPYKTADPGAKDLALAQRYLSNKPGPLGIAAATRYLWAAVEKGNVKAEIRLADLYARGDGVTKSCDQAEELLRAAARKGSSEAYQELAQIIRRGCP